MRTKLSQHRCNRNVGFTTEQNPGNRNHLRDLDKHLLHEIKDFFITYQRLMGKKFEIHGEFGPKEAKLLVQKSLKK